MATPKKDKPKKAGRHTDFKVSYISKARMLCESGKTDLEMARHFGVDVTTFHRWKRAHPEFRHAIKKGKEIADFDIKTSLYTAAKGHGQPGDDDYVAPDTTAMIFFLKNRLPEEFRDTKVFDHGDGLPTKPPPYDPEIQELAHDAIMRYAKNHQPKEKDK